MSAKIESGRAGMMCAAEELCKVGVWLPKNIHFSNPRNVPTPRSFTLYDPPNPIYDR